VGVSDFFALGGRGRCGVVDQPVEEQEHRYSAGGGFYVEGS